ncbi:unnamed protein product, partial [Cladocopium goreaui]
MAGSTSVELEKALGSELQDHFGWPLQLKQAHLEVWLFVTEEHLVGLLLMRQLKSRPVYSSSTGLHPNVAWAMLNAAEVLPGEVLLDPMCGTGMLLTEAPMHCHVLGADISPDMISRAAAHFRSLQHPHWSLLRADVRHLPLPDASVDVVVCDLPFGRQFGTVEANRLLYPQALKEIRRVTRASGRCVLLTSLENRETLMSAVGESWSSVEEVQWNLANKLPAVLLFLSRTEGAAPRAPRLAAFGAGAGRFALQRKQQSPQLVLCQQK